MKMPDMNEIVAQLKAGFHENFTAIQAEHGEIAEGALVEGLERLAEVGSVGDVRAAFCLAVLYFLGDVEKDFVTGVEFNGALAIKWIAIARLYDKNFAWAQKFIILKTPESIDDGRALLNEWFQSRILRDS